MFRIRPLLAVLCIALPATGLCADGVYTYTEADGTIVYTNVQPSGRKARKLQGTFSAAPAKSAEVVIPRAKTDLGEFNRMIDVAATRYRIPRALVRAIMHAESNFNPMALSNKGASGLMQLMPGTAQEMYVKDIFGVRDNIEGGTRYLRVLANTFEGNMVKMIAAYNAGPEAVRKHGGKVPPYAETQAYVKKVLGLYRQYKVQLQGEAPPEAAQAQAEAPGGAAAAGN